MNWSPKHIGSLPSSLKHFRYCLLAITITLSAVYLTLIWRAGDDAHVGMSLLFGMAAGNLLWERRHNLRLGSDLLSASVGCLLIGGVLWQVSTSPTPTPAPGEASYAILRIMPFVAALGICLIASGLKGLRQYWQELAILFFLGVPSVLAAFLPDISPITAKVSAFFLWYTGFDVSVQGVYVRLPTGAVQVYSGCSGIESMTYLLGLSIVCLLSFPITGIKRFFIPFIAVLIGYFINILRVALMVILAAAQNKAAFDYWHVGNGSLVFGASAILFFGLFYLFLMQKEKSRQSNSESNPVN